MDTDMVNENAELLARLLIRISVLETECGRLEGHVEGLQAQAAAMRKMVEKYRIHLEAEPWHCGCYPRELKAKIDEIDQALSTTAGAAILERLKAMEAVVDAAKERSRIKERYKQKQEENKGNLMWPWAIEARMAGQDLGRADDALDAALAAYDAKGGGE